MLAKNNLFASLAEGCGALLPITCLREAFGPGKTDGCEEAKSPSDPRGSALEDLERLGAHLDPGFDPEMLVVEKKHLPEAVESLLPPTARQVVGREVEPASAPTSSALR